MIWEVLSQLCERIAASMTVSGFDAGFADAADGDDKAEFHAQVHLVPRAPGSHSTLPSGPEWVDLGMHP